jgi:hypothetical protein
MEHFTRDCFDLEFRLLCLMSAVSLVICGGVIALLT